MRLSFHPSDADLLLRAPVKGNPRKLPSKMFLLLFAVWTNAGH